MNQSINKILKTIGLYKPILNFKRRLDRLKSQKMERSFHKDRVSFYRQILNPGYLVFDVGANIGNRVQVFKELGCNVIAVEPQQNCVEVLKKKFGNSIVIEQIGLGKEEGELEMLIADESTISTFSNEFVEKTKNNKFKRNSWNKRQKIKISTLNNLIGKYGLPDFCKIDVEGFESEVLKGLSTKIPFISFEYNVPEMSENVYQCLQLLNNISNDYLFNFSIGESMSLKLVQWLPFKDFISITHSETFLNSDFGDIYATVKH
jgi:FkbM family methyltransferase